MWIKYFLFLFTIWMLRFYFLYLKYFLLFQLYIYFFCLLLWNILTIWNLLLAFIVFFLYFDNRILYLYFIIFYPKSKILQYSLKCKINPIKIKFLIFSTLPTFIILFYDFLRIIIILIIIIKIIFIIFNKLYPFDFKYILQKNK